MVSMSETMCVESMTMRSPEREWMRLRKRTRSRGSSPCGGLVEDEQPGLVEHGDGYAYALEHAA